MLNSISSNQNDAFYHLTAAASAPKMHGCSILNRSVAQQVIKQPASSPMTVLHIPSHTLSLTITCPIGPEIYHEGAGRAKRSNAGKVAKQKHSKKDEVKCDSDKSDKSASHLSSPADVGQVFPPILPIPQYRWPSLPDPIHSGESKFNVKNLSESPSVISREFPTEIPLEFLSDIPTNLSVLFVCKGNSHPNNPDPSKAWLF